MKTIKITEDTHNKLQYLKVTFKIDKHLKIKTLDEVIQYLYECFLEIGEKEERLVDEKAKEILNERR